MRQETLPTPSSMDLSGYVCSLHAPLDWHTNYTSDANRGTRSLFDRLAMISFHRALYRLTLHPPPPGVLTQKHPGYPLRPFSFFEKRTGNCCRGYPTRILGIPMSRDCHRWGTPCNDPPSTFFKTQTFYRESPSSLHSPLILAPSLPGRLGTRAEP